MAAKKRYAIAFIHGLAKKPSPDKLEEINVYDPLDVVCGADPRLSNDYTSVSGKSVEDVKESNWGNWRHTITHYFAGKTFRMRLAEAIGVDLS